MAVDGITVTGRYEAIRTVAVLGHRLRHTELAAPSVFRVLELYYRMEFNRGFGRYRGFLIDTGATQEAWTVRSDHSSENAIRERHHGIEFGSNIYYNRFWQGYLLHIPRWVDDDISRVVADFLVPEELLGGPRVKGTISGYFATRTTKSGPRETWVRPHARGVEEHFG
jgi:hypothetical protein